MSSRLTSSTPPIADRLTVAGLSTAATGLPLTGLGALLALPIWPVVVTTLVFSVTLYQVALSMHAARVAVGQVREMKALPAAPQGQEGQR